MTTKKTSWAFSLFFSLTFLVLPALSLETQPRVEYFVPHFQSPSSPGRIPLDLPRWSRFPAKVAIRAIGNESYAQAAIQAVENWNFALRSFREAYGFGYTELSQIRFEYSVSLTASGDLYVRFEDRFDPGGHAQGQIIGHYDSQRGVWLLGVEIFIYLKTSTGRSLSRDEVVTVVTHELAHALGLGHTNEQFTEDGHTELMYGQSRALEPIEYPSTLDVYAIAKYYFGGVGMGNTEILPVGIPYNAISSLDAISIDAIIDTMRDKENTIKTQLQRLQNDYNSLKSSHDRLRSDYDSLNSRFLSLEILERELAGNYRVLSGRYDDLRRTNENLNVVVESQKMELTQKQTAIDGLQAEKEELARSLEVSRQNLQRLNFASLFFVLGLSILMVLVFVLMRKHERSFIRI